MHKAKRWKPEYNGYYFLVEDFGRVNNMIWRNDRIDKLQFAFGNVFKTKRQAQQAAKAVKEILLAFHRGNNDY